MTVLRVAPVGNTHTNFLNDTTIKPAVYFNFDAGFDDDSNTLSVRNASRCLATGGTVKVPGNGMWVDSIIRGGIIGESAARLQDDFAVAYYIIQKNCRCLYHAIVIYSG